MTTDNAVTTPPAELIPIWEHDANARWLVSIASDRAEGNDWSGWTDVDADAIDGTVEHAGVVMTPPEARNLAEALRQAADHAEHFGHARASFLTSLTGVGHLPELDDLPVETQRALRDALRAAAERYRRRYPTEARVVPEEEL
jgi:hypothetical protein